MKNITFTILNNNNQLITLNCTLNKNNNKLYRCGIPVYCNCQKKHPVPYLFLNDEVYCPACGKKSLSVTFEKTDDSLKLIYLGKDYNTMQDLYRLSNTLQYKTWLNVADYFIKLKTYDVDMGYPIEYVGWVTSNPDTVEKLLNIPEKLQIKNRNVDKELESSLKKKREDNNNVDEVELYTIIDDLHAVFSVVETPYGQFELDGELFENPLHPPSNYGRGEYWIVTDEKIWFVRYNFRDGDNLNFNNVLVDGSLKAIGKCIGFDENVYELLLRLTN